MAVDELLQLCGFGEQKPVARCGLGLYAFELDADLVALLFRELEFALVFEDKLGTEELPFEPLIFVAFFCGVQRCGQRGDKECEKTGERGDRFHRSDSSREIWNVSGD